MILRLSAKLAAKLKVAPTKVLPLAENPFADWSGHIFTADRTQYVIVSSTGSLYSTVFYARGIPTDSHFIERALSSLREFMEGDELSFVYQRYIAPASGTVQYSKPFSPSITTSLSNLIFHAKRWLAEGELSPHDTATRLNAIPCASSEFRNPREAFMGLLSAKPVRDDSTDVE